MTVSAHDVARELRAALPGLGVKKLHKLLYLGQAHHLAWFARPLFGESIHAFDMGPMVRSLWQDENVGRTVLPMDLDEAALNTVGYVVSRYGSLNGRDLEILSHGQDPWIRADQTRRSSGSDLIDLESMQTYFAAAADDEDETPWPDGATIRSWLAGAADRRDPAPVFDDIERLRARARGE